MLSLIAQVDSVSSIINTARVEAVDQFDPDSTPGNDAPAEDDQDSVTITPASANLSLTKTVNKSNPSVGEQVTFTITVTNSGPNTATGVEVTDQLPVGTTFASVTPCARSTGVPPRALTSRSPASTRKNAINKWCSYSIVAGVCALAMVTLVISITR